MILTRTLCTWFIHRSRADSNCTAERMLTPVAVTHAPHVTAGPSELAQCIDQPLPQF